MLFFPALEGGALLSPSFYRRINQLKLSLSSSLKVMGPANSRSQNSNPQLVATPGFSAALFPTSVSSPVKWVRGFLGTLGIFCQRKWQGGEGRGEVLRSLRRWVSTADLNSLAEMEEALTWHVWSSWLSLPHRGQWAWAWGFSAFSPGVLPPPWERCCHGSRRGGIPREGVCCSTWTGAFH